MDLNNLMSNKKYRDKILCIMKVTLFENNFFDINIILKTPKLIRLHGIIKMIFQKKKHHPINCMFLIWVNDMHIH